MQEEGKSNGWYYVYYMPWSTDLEFFLDMKFKVQESEIDWVKWMPLNEVDRRAK